MIRVEAVRARIGSQVPALAGRIDNAGQFAALVERNQLPQITPAAFVLPGGLSGGKPDASAGIFSQDISELVLVVLVVRVAGDARGGKALDTMTPLVNAVVNAVAGWGPSDAPGVYILDRAELVGAKDGALVFQIDFSLADQLRIAA